MAAETFPAGRRSQAEGLRIEVRIGVGIAAPTSFVCGAEERGAMPEELRPALPTNLVRRVGKRPAGSGRYDRSPALNSET